MDFAVVYMNRDVMAPSVVSDDFVGNKIIAFF